jgi:hypothetical protein
LDEKVAQWFTNFKKKYLEILILRKYLEKKCNININIYNKKISYRRLSIILRKYFKILLNLTCLKHQDFRFYIYVAVT